MIPIISLVLDRGKNCSLFSMNRDTRRSSSLQFSWSYLFYRRAILIKAISGKATTHDEVVNMKSALKLYAVNSVEKQLSEDQENEIYTYIHDTKNLPLKNIYKLLRLAIIHDNRLVKDIVGQLMMKKLSH